MNKNTITVGFAVFTMFFGAGNMVLPLFLMQRWPEQWFPAFLGFCVTAVFVTLLGLIASVLVKGDIKKFFAPLGLVGGVALQMVLIAVEGPFGIVPRSLIIAYGGVKTLWPINDHIFYFVSCIAIYCLAINKHRIIKVIGNIVTPMMLLFLILIVAYSFLTYGMGNITFKLENGGEAFLDGLFEGYLTYDLPGAIYFTSIAMFYLTSISKNQEAVISNGVKASFFSAGLLILVYSLFIYLGLSHRDILINTMPEQILPTIVDTSLGPIVSIIFATFIFLGCLTTAVAAITIWTDFVCHYIPQLNYRMVLVISLFIAFAVSSLDFTHLMKLLAPLLNFVYPILMLLTLYNIAIYIKKKRKS